MTQSQAEHLVYELLLEADRALEVVVSQDQAHKLARRIVSALFPDEPS